MEHTAEGAQKVITDFGAFVPDGLCRPEPTGRGILNGRTFAVKDLIDIAGCRTGAGNPDWLAYQAPAARSAPVVEKALAAGAALVGKTVTDELAFSLEGRNIHYPSLTNPICPNRLPGGSSSGSAVAVAAGQVDFALGTDTGGSVRVPANFLGLFGFRPSHGVLPLDGVVPFAPSYDTVGWLSRDADMLVDVGTALLPGGKPVPITKLLLARDAFALADHELAQQLKARIANWRITGTITIYDGNEVSVRQDIIERSDGIPLFVEEMTKAVLEAANEGTAERVVAVIPSPSVAVPASQLVRDDVPVVDAFGGC
jgi:amidase